MESWYLSVHLVNSRGKENLLIVIIGIILPFFIIIFLDTIVENKKSEIFLQYYKIIN